MAFNKGRFLKIDEPRVFRPEALGQLAHVSHPACRHARDFRLVCRRAASGNMAGECIQGGIPLRGGLQIKARLITLFPEFVENEEVHAREIFGQPPCRLARASFSNRFTRSTTVEKPTWLCCECRLARWLWPDATCCCRFLRSSQHCVVRPKSRRLPGCE
jgi:hypothetical protein